MRRNWVLRKTGEADVDGKLSIPKNHLVKSDGAATVEWEDERATERVPTRQWQTIAKHESAEAVEEKWEFRMWDQERTSAYVPRVLRQTDVLQKQASELIRVGRQHPPISVSIVAARGESCSCRPEASLQRP